jgi:Na+/melibiose symporter-like transporter
LLAGVIAGHGDQGRCEGAYFGLWNLLTKLNLALAAGIGLPALGWLRTVDLPSAPTVALPLAYAGLPCLLKLVAGGVLLCAPPHPGGAASQRPPIS